MGEKYHVWHRPDDESQWMPHTRDDGVRYEHSLDSAIKCGRFFARMLGHEHKRTLVETEDVVSL